MASDVIIVGGGIIGCTHGYYLAKRGLKVTLLERGEIGGGTTANNFSWINASGKTSDADYHHLNALGVCKYSELAEQFGADTLALNPLGSLGLVRRSDPVNYETMRKTADALEEFNYPAQWLNTEELREHEPSVDFADDAEALFAPTEKCLYASHFARFMADQIRALGGNIRQNCAANTLLMDDTGTITGVSTAQGELTAPCVVITTGPDTAQTLSDLTGYDGFASRFPVNKVPGLLVTTPPVAPDLLRHLNYTDTGGEFHFMPDFNGGLRLASDDVDGALIDDQSPEHLRHLALGLLEKMQEFAPKFPGAALIDECQLNIGIRAYPADGKSIAGAFPDAPGLFLIATHSGVTLAPALGSLMAELVATGNTPALLEPFAITRLPGFG